MRKWTVTIEASDGSGLEYTYTVRAESVVEAAHAAEAYNDDNYVGMEVTSIVLGWE